MLCSIITIINIYKILCEVILSHSNELKRNTYRLFFTIENKSTMWSRFNIFFSTCLLLFFLIFYLLFVFDGTKIWKKEQRKKWTQSKRGECFVIPLNLSFPFTVNHTVQWHVCERVAEKGGKSVERWCKSNGK